MARKAVLTLLVYAYTLSVMLGLGSSIKVNIWEEVKKAPRAVICGFCSQFGFMPLLTFLLAVAFGLGDTESVALLLIGMSPGGVTSTLFCYLSECNVTVSLVMTTLSTFTALFMMPLLLFIYARPPLVSSNDSRISYLAIIVTLLIATIPAILGWRIRAKWARLGELLETWATRFGFGLIIITIIAIFAWQPSGGTAGVTGKSVIVMLLLCPCGFILGYGAASLIFGLDVVLARTVSIETGIQQVGIAGAIAVNSFSGSQLDKMVQIMAIFGAITFSYGLAWAAFLRWWGLPAPVDATIDDEKNEKSSDVELAGIPCDDDDLPATVTA